ncbi:MAG: type II secretion protein [Nitrospirota bacterium]|jgi:uncharacterized membrane protein YidH (DUF202 family)
MAVTDSITKYRVLIEKGIIAEKEFEKACGASRARGLELEKVLLEEHGVPRLELLRALSEYYGLSHIEYDERMPVPSALLAGLDSEMLSTSVWFPVIEEENKAVIAANNPEDPSLDAEVRTNVEAGQYDYRVALASDVQWYIKDFLHAKPEHIIGIERTGLAFWRNTMAHWRTRLACYRTDLAKGRTSLAVLRWGIGLIALSDALMRFRGGALFMNYLYWVMMLAGFFLAAPGLVGYLKVRKSSIGTTRHQTLVEVTAATVQFLEDYHIEDTPKIATKGTMLARLGDFITNYCTILRPVPSSKERTQLARERNVLAAQRTLAACYRTIYSRARTGLALIRTGVALSSLGMVLLKYFGPSVLTAVDMAIFTAGLLMTIDGFIWYMPARVEQVNLRRASAL